MRVIARVAWLVSLVAVVFAGMARADGKPEAVADARGNLHVPSGYPEVYEFLGTWAIAADKQVGSSQIHNVYATPGTIAAYRSSGHFPDGTVLIKEVYETSTARMTTGTVSQGTDWIYTPGYPTLK